MASVSLILFSWFVAVNAQWVMYNTSHINTTWVRPPGYYPQVYPPSINNPYHNPYNTSVYKGPQNYYPAPPGIIGGKNSHSVIIGAPGPYDVLLFKQYYQKSGRLWLAREKLVQYPPKGSKNNNYTITAINLIDRDVDGKGGYATVQSGGVGHKNVTIKLESSQTSRGFNFKVEIFGRRDSR